MNILINRQCNLSCPYCFAKGHLQNTDDAGSNMSLETFRTILTFLDKSGYKNCRIQGGEPTLHKKFPELLKMAIKLGFRIKLFTNGLFDDKVSAVIKNYSASISVTVNLNHPETYEPVNWNKITQNLSVIPKNSAISINVFRVDQDCRYALDLLDEYGFEALRIGMTHSTGNNHSNQHCEHNNYKQYYEIINDLARKALSSSLFVCLECGITPCQVDRYIPKIVARNPRFFVENCETCPSVNSDLEVFQCFQYGVEGSKRHLSDFSDLEEIYRYYKYIDTLYSHIYLYEHCGPDCIYRINGLCAGGCLSDRKVKSVKCNINCDMIPNSFYEGNSEDWLIQLASKDQTPEKYRLMGLLGEIAADEGRCPSLQPGEYKKVLKAVKDNGSDLDWSRLTYWEACCFSSNETETKEKMCLYLLGLPEIKAAIRRKIWHTYFQAVFSQNISKLKFKMEIITNNIERAVKEYPHDEKLFLCHLTISILNHEEEAALKIIQNYLKEIFYSPFRSNTSKRIINPLMAFAKAVNLENDVKQIIYSILQIDRYQNDF